MRSIVDLFETSVKKYRDNAFLLEKQEGVYKATTYGQVKKKVLNLASGLIQRGIKKEDRVALLSEGRNSWIIGELGVLYTGAINVPLSIKLNPEELKFRLNHSETKMIIVSSLQLWKVREIKKELPHLEGIVILDQDNYEEKEIYREDLLEDGSRVLEQNISQLNQVRETLQSEDYANIMYTSGTTSDPKGVILSHGNYITNIEQCFSLIDVDESFRTLTILPLDHCFAHVGNMYIFMCRGASLATVEVGKTPMETLKNIPNNIKEVRPHIILSVPALAKNFKKNIETAIKEKGSTAYKLFNHALKLAYAYNKEGYNKGSLRHLFKKPLLKLYDKILFSKIRKGFGNELKYFIGGGAYLDIEIQRFFYAIGMPMFQGYGLSEATPVISSNSLDRHKLGSSGFPVKNLEIKILDEKGKTLPVGQKGEVVVKGENVMKGYWKNQEATQNTIKEGWLYTGDLGYMDKDGFLYISGRVKSLLIGNDGEKYSPEAIEEMVISQSLYIEQIMLYNDQNPYTTALVVPDGQALKKYLESKKVLLDSEEATKLVLKIIEEDIQQYYTGGRYSNLFPDRWLPTAVSIIEEPFSESNGFINSTLKMVRPKITSFYKSRIEDLYTPEGKKWSNPQNIKSIKTILLDL